MKGKRNGARMAWRPTENVLFNVIEKLVDVSTRCLKNSEITQKNKT
jgi:hypothetical protein